jgi:hypothetical protein
MKQWKIKIPVIIQNIRKYKYLCFKDEIESDDIDDLPTIEIRRIIDIEWKKVEARGARAKYVVVTELMGGEDNT